MPQLRRKYVLSVLSATVLAATGATALAAAPSTPLVRTKAVLPGLAHARRVGDAAHSTKLTIGLSLAHPNPGGEAAAYKAMYTPGSPSYHDFLTTTQYAATFGVAKAVTDSAVSWLKSGGLHVDAPSAVGDYVTATGTVAQLAKLMHTSFGSYTVGPLSFIANTIAPEVPKDLPVTAVLGLNTLSRSWTPSQVHAVDAKSNLSAALMATLFPKAAKPAAASAPYTGLLTPQNLWGVYNLPKTNEGQGATAGLFMEGYTNSVVANLRVYEKRNHLPQVPVRVVRSQAGTDTEFGDNLDAIEWYLDSDAITGMAPQLSQLNLYTMTNLADVQVGKAISKWASDPQGPLQMNASFGECEASPLNPVLGPLAQPPFYYGTEAGDELEAEAEPILQQANLEGRTLFSSTGDTGGSCPVVVVPVVGAGNGLIPQPVPEQNYPAISPHVTGVAGTVVTISKQVTARQPAARDHEDGWTYSGGGSSFWTAEPAYQKNVAAIKIPCVVNSSATPYPPGTICRGAPDIADMSGTVMSYESGALLDTNEYDIESDMTQSSEGGTSLSSPLAVGMWSRIQAAAPVKGLGFANESFYKVGASAKYHQDFTDITQSETAGGNFYYHATPGWDYVTGWGAMNVAHLMKDLTGRLTPSHPKPAVTLVENTSGCVSWTSPTGNANNALYPGTTDPSLDIQEAKLRISGGRNLIAIIAGQTLAPHAGLGETGGANFTMLWTVDDETGPTTYFAAARVTNGGAISYVDGVSNGSYSAQHTIQGSFVGGTITLIIPLKDVGSPTKGTKLQYPYAFSAGGIAPATPATNPITQTEDVATAPQPGQALVVGAPCRSA